MLPSHNGGGDSQGIASMVTIVIATFGVDPTKVFVTETSSGGTQSLSSHCCANTGIAMMANVMAGSYPEFRNSITILGCCLLTRWAWNTQCVDGDLIKTPQEWVRISSLVL